MNNKKDRLEIFKSIYIKKKMLLKSEFEYLLKYLI